METCSIEAMELEVARCLNHVINCPSLIGSTLVYDILARLHTYIGLDL